jgi:hypothetical protein
VCCQVDAARFDALLADPGKVDCPLLSALGYPVILVSTTPGRQCIPVVSQGGRGWGDKRRDKIWLGLL